MSPGINDLSGKKAFVTGGARGIGAAIVRRLAADGAAVAYTYVAKTPASGAPKALAIRADAADAEAAASAVAEAARSLGGLDILVNNAGVFVTGPIGDPASDGAALARQFAVNVEGVVSAVRAAVGVMKDGGRIITIGSVAARRSPWPGLAEYSATKAAVAALTRGWSRDLGPRRITVNVVQPGPVDTEMNPADGVFSEAQKAQTALGRYGTPDEVAAVVAFLARDEAAYVTGAAIDVDGGWGA